MSNGWVIFPTASCASPKRAALSLTRWTPRAVSFMSRGSSMDYGPRSPCAARNAPGSTPSKNFFVSQWRKPLHRSTINLALKTYSKFAALPFSAHSHCCATPTALRVPTKARTRGSSIFSPSACCCHSPRGQASSRSRRQPRKAVPLPYTRAGMTTAIVLHVKIFAGRYTKPIYATENRRAGSMESHIFQTAGSNP
jgi:hypothetical protein